ncbi:MAG: hypothetical protein ACK4NF_07645, partial [Planctomycetota bacterium]
MKKYYYFFIFLSSLIVGTQDFSEVVAKLRKSVVTIKFTIKMNIMGRELEQDFAQRAIVISDDLIVVTDGAPLTEQVGSTFSWTNTGFKIGGDNPPAFVKPRYARVY